MENKLTEKIVGAVIEVDLDLGLGLLDSVFKECLLFELKLCEMIL
jgi:hypothetical protein